MKFFACLMTAFFFNGVVLGASIEVEGGEKLSCERRNEHLYFCNEKTPGIFIVNDGGQFLAIKKDKDGGFYSRRVTEVVDDGHLIHSEDLVGFGLAEVTKSAKIEFSKSLEGMSVYQQFTFPEVKQMLQEAKEYALKNKDFGKKIDLDLSTGEKYACEKGRSIDEENLQCDFFSCENLSTKEKALGYFPQDLHIGTPTLLTLPSKSMAKIYSGEMRASSKDELVFEHDTIAFDEGVEMEFDPKYNNPEKSIDRKLFIPQKYHDDLKTYAFLETMAHPVMKEREMYCTGEVKKLLGQQASAISKLETDLSNMELTEYIKILNDELLNVYVDKTQSMSLGCYYEGKVVDYSALKEFKRLKEISNLNKEIRPISEDEVQELFKKAKGMEDLPFEYKYDGCYARAHLMAKRFEEMGYEVNKAWIKGDLFVEGTDIEWNYHVAPLVNVKTKSGEIVRYVIDPSMSDKAVTFDDWVKSISKRTSGPVVETTYPFPVNPVNFNKTVIATSNSSVYGPEDEKGMTEQDKMEASKQVLAEFKKKIDAGFKVRTK